MLQSPAVLSPASLGCLSKIQFARMVDGGCSIGWLRQRLFFFRRFWIQGRFLDSRPVSAASDLQPWIYGGLEILIFNSKTPV
jgi:hypothetical protein